MNKGTRNAEEGLVRRVILEMNNLGIPKWGDPDNEEGLHLKKFPHLDQYTVLQDDVYSLLANGPQIERGHNMRVAIYGSGESDILGFKKEARLLKFLTDIAHDRGKINLKHLYPENIGGCIAKLEEFKKQHVDVHNLPTNYGYVVASAIERTHLHQEAPYPLKPIFRKTPKNDFLSKLTAIGDCWDALFSRTKQCGCYRTTDEAMSKLLEIYGNMEIKYKGEIFPKIEISGAELISELSNYGILARNKPKNISEKNFRMNPFI